MIMFVFLFLCLTFLFFATKSNAKKETHKTVPYESAVTAKQLAFEKMRDEAVTNALSAMGLENPSHWYWSFCEENVVIATERTKGSVAGAPIGYKVEFAELSPESVVVHSIQREHTKNPFIVTKPEQTIEEAAAFFGNILDNDISIITSINKEINDYGSVSVSGAAINGGVKLTKNQIKGLKQAFIKNEYDIEKVDYEEGLFTLAFSAKE